VGSLRAKPVSRQLYSSAIVRTDWLGRKIASLRKEVTRLNAVEKAHLDAPDKQLSLTDPDARSMKARGMGIVGYNVLNQEKETLATDELNVVADRG